MCHAMPFAAQKHFLSRWYCDKEPIECGLASSVLLRTRICVITVVKVCCGLNRLRYVMSDNILTTVMSISLSIRVQTTLNHIRLLNSIFLCSLFHRCDNVYFHII